MCRLLYIDSKSEFSIPEQLEKFAAVAKNSKEFQGHGWGFAHLSGGEWKYYKNVKPIWEDDLSGFGTAKRLIAHARSAFRDEGIAVENNMPFYDDQNIFIFNGELRGVKIKEEGRIGAEKIFNYIKRFDKGDMLSALEKGTDVISKRSSYIRAMNIIIAGKEAAYVSSLFNEDEQYFTMHLKKEADRLTICSEVFEGEQGWLPIENKTVRKFECI